MCFLVLNLGGRWRCRGYRYGEEDGDGEGDGDGDGEGDEGRRRFLKEDGDIEIHNAPCVIRRHGPNLLHLKILE
jgi:hypothetical protein